MGKQDSLPQEQLFDTHAESSLDFEIVRQASLQKYTRPFLILDTVIRQISRDAVKTVPASDQSIVFGIAEVSP